jgi:hypothetical protein
VRDSKILDDMTKTRKRDHTEEPPLEVQMAGAILDIPPAGTKGKLSASQYNILENDLAEVRRGHRISLQGWAKYCKDAKEFGFTGKESLEYGFSRLRGIVAKSTLYEWAHKTLPDDSFATTKPKSGTTKIPEPESSTSQRSLPQKQLEQEQQREGGRLGYLNEEHECYKDTELEKLRKVKDEGVALIKNTPRRDHTMNEEEYTVECMVKIAKDFKTWEDQYWWESKFSDGNRGKKRNDHRMEVIDIPIIINVRPDKRNATAKVNMELLDRMIEAQDKAIANWKPNPLH